MGTGSVFAHPQPMECTETLGTATGTGPVLKTWTELLSGLYNSSHAT